MPKLDPKNAPECTGNVHIQPAMQSRIQQRRIISSCILDVPDVLIQVQVLVDPAWARLDRQEDSLELLLAAEMTDPESSGCDDLDFSEEFQAIAVAKTALEVNRG